MTDHKLPPGTLLKLYDEDELRRIDANGDAVTPDGIVACQRKFVQALINDKAYKVVSPASGTGTLPLLFHDSVYRPEKATREVRPGDWLASLSNSERKECAMHRGLLAYFPDALAMVARHSVRSNEKHNPGQPVHWAREKSTDHNDCIVRHSAAIAADPMAQDDGQHEIVCRAWRALAALQVWIEEQHAKGAKL